MTALANKSEIENSYRNRFIKGFTIVELLIVVVVIAILAAIVIVAYNGITNRAETSVIHSGLNSVAKDLELYKIRGNDEYPASLSQLQNGQTFTNSGYIYKRIGNGGYCVASTPKDGVSFRLKNGGKVEQGQCELEGIVTTLPVDVDMVRSIAFDSSGNMYATTYYASSTENHMVIKITPDGTVTQFAGSGINGFAEGQGTAARFYMPQDIEVGPNGTIYVADYANHRIRQISPTGLVSTLVGEAGPGAENGSCATAKIATPSGLAFDPNGNLYFTDLALGRVRKIDMSTCTVSTLAGPDYSSIPGGPEAGFVNGTGTEARFDEPAAIEYNPSDGNLYVSEGGNEAIRRVTLSGEVSTLASGSPLGSLVGLDLAIDSDGTIYRANDYGENIIKVTIAGVATVFAGSDRGLLDGVGTAAQFYRPQGVEFGPDGSLYVADTYSRAIRVIK